MATISQIEIQKRNKNRVNLYVDGEFYSGLQLVAVARLGLREGMEVDESQLKEAVSQSEISYAFEKCVDYLSKSMKTTKQIRDYLRKKGFSKEVEEIVVQKLKNYRYVDDDLYTQLYTEQNSKFKGSRRIKSELLQKGIHKELIDSVEVEADTQRQTADALAQKYMKGKDRDVKTLQKLQRFLVYRGFDYDTVGQIISRYRKNEDDWD
ncbi:MAG: RecX family transcriptional regulator [Clostridia bacterium]|nr:RecX family transcriptional regulator [Clostridia bacterium]